MSGRASKTAAGPAPVSAPPGPPGAPHPTIIAAAATVTMPKSRQCMTSSLGAEASRPSAAAQSTATAGNQRLDFGQADLDGSQAVFDAIHAMFEAIHAVVERENCVSSNPVSRPASARAVLTVVPIVRCRCSCGVVSPCRSPIIVHRHRASISAAIRHQAATRDTTRTGPDGRHAQAPFRPLRNRRARRGSSRSVRQYPIRTATISTAIATRYSFRSSGPTNCSQRW